MPMIKYVCETKQIGHTTSKLFRSSSDIASEIACSVCGAKAKRSLSSPGSSSKIVIDNGIQARAVEIDPDIMSINSERARKPENRGD